MKRDWSPHEPELMDRPQPVSAELERDLENLESLNRRFGSHAIVRSFLERWLRPGDTCRVLDLCTGYGDIPRLMRGWAGARGVDLTVEAVDFHPSTLAIARSRSAADGGIVYTQGDALDFGNGAEATYDLVHCSLALHHFSDADAERLLRRCRHLSRGRVLVVDLERSRLTQAAVWAVTSSLYRDPMTRHDARLSVRRAFSFAEFAGLARRAGWERFGHRRYFPCRQAIWLE